MQGIPITWGYLLLPFATLLRRDLRFSHKELSCLLALIPLQLLFLFGVLTHGIEDLGFFLSFLFSFFLLPLCFFCFDFSLLQPSWIRRGVLFLAGYGLFLFFYKLFTGDFFTIPYLTVNASDINTIGEKCIQRGNYFKLISTYQNGNLFGICMLMLLPLYSRYEKSLWKKAIVKLAVLLTLSRTVWAGLFFFELLYSPFVEKKWKLGMEKILLSGLGLLALSYWMGFSFDFFFDASLGGRKAGFDILHDLTLFPNKPFGAIQEIVYLGILENLGLLGLFAFLLALSLPIFYQTDRAKKMGMLLFLFLSLSDGALLFIPVMAVYWTLSGESRILLPSPPQSRPSTSAANSTSKS